MNLKFMFAIIAAALLLSAISGCITEEKQKTIPVENKTPGNLTIIQDQITSEEDAKKHNSNGLSLAEETRFSEAEMEFREAINLNPNFAEAHLNLGNVLENFNRNSEAEKEYRKAIELSPDFAEARSNLGSLLARSGRYDEAEKEFRSI